MWLRPKDRQKTHDGYSAENAKFILLFNGNLDQERPGTFTLRWDASPMTDETQQGSLDAYTATELAYRVETVGVSKARMSLSQLIGLGFMGGVFVSFGAMFFTMTLAQGLPRIVASITFSLGLILVIVGGAEMFTGNNLIVMAWAQGKIRTSEMVRNWFWVYATNFAGCLVMVALVYLSGGVRDAHLEFGVAALKIAAVKTNLTFTEAFFKGLLCNALVCMAVWLCLAARTVLDRILCIVFPIAGFVNMGFEQCVANMFFLPIGYLVMQDTEVVATSHLAPSAMAHINVAGFLGNLAAVTLGNMIGGAVLVAGVYYVVYLRGQRRLHDLAIKSTLIRSNHKML
jgi:formate/nitrite transporter